VSITASTSNGVARIGIARPEKKNALTVAMYQAMADAIGAAHDDGSVRAILIHGEKDVFTAGNDLEDFMKNPPTEWTRRCSSSCRHSDSRKSRWSLRSTAPP
jgi:enoyl-CoA hydratase/carnithine racemase